MKEHSCLEPPEPIQSITFGERVRTTRMKKKITLSKFAAMLGISMTDVSQIERNEIIPCDKKRQTIVALLGIYERTHV